MKPKTAPCHLAIPVISILMSAGGLGLGLGLAMSAAYAAPPPNPKVVTPALPSPKTTPLPPWQFKFDFKVSLANLDPDVEEARVSCAVASKTELPEFVIGTSKPLNLNAENQHVFIYINGVESPAEYTIWICGLAFQLAGQMEHAFDYQDCPDSIKQQFGLTLCVPGAITRYQGSFATKPTP